MEGMSIRNSTTHLALSGGIGGAKLALGLEHVFNSSNLMIAGNTGDDFKHFGLHISPDLDTLLYTLSGKSDTERGWGLSNETWSFMEAMGEMGGETWFQLGDRDLATHVERTRRLNEGENHSSITSSFCKKFGVKAQIVPATDDPLKTLVQTPEGILTFQNTSCGINVGPRFFHYNMKVQKMLNPVLPSKRLSKVHSWKRFLYVLPIHS